jgi:gamma-glutamylcysteine synthetase
MISTDILGGRKGTNVRKDLDEERFASFSRGSNLNTESTIHLARYKTPLQYNNGELRHSYPALSGRLAKHHWCT